MRSDDFVIVGLGTGADQMSVPLFCKTCFSFLEGASQPDELVETARAMGYPAIAITDRDGVYGIVRAYVAAKRLEIRLIVGSEVSLLPPGSALPDLAPRGANPSPPSDLPPSRLENSCSSQHPHLFSSLLPPGSALLPPGPAPPDPAVPDPASPSIILLVETREGYSNLCKLITKGRLREQKGKSRISWLELCEHAEGLVALWRGSFSPSARDNAAALTTGIMKEAFRDRLYLLITRHHAAEEAAHERRLMSLSREHRLPIVATNEVLYHSRDRRPLQDVLTCIRRHVTLGAAGTLIKPNSEFALKPPDEMRRLFADMPMALAASDEIAERCAFSMSELRYRYPSEALPDGTTTAGHLRDLTFEGARARYNGAVPPETSRQIVRELSVIEELDYCGYFLTMHEIVAFCRRSEILCQGRGSAANSAVCFCLGITAIDPVRSGLLFERFISRERAEPPDIDLDIEHERREEVIQHVYEKYGRDRAAMVANVIRYRTKSAVRDVAKVLGVKQNRIELLVKRISRHSELTEDLLKDAGLDPDERTNRHLIRFVNEIQDFPRHLSIHPGGFLLGHEPVHTLVPIENGSMPGRTVIQWNKDDVEAMGLFKVDLLGLGALHQLHLTFDLLKKHRGIDLELATIPPEDKATFDMACRGDTIGVFQIESRAQMAMLPRLRPRSFYDLVIEISLVRPGPITGGMVHPYLRRRSGEEKIDYPHPSLEPVLKKTLGIPLFQEQVMKLAVVAADYSPGEADQLRRDMAAWKRAGRIEGHREVLVARMKAKGIPGEFAERVFEQIRGFGEYGFPESHAASFAIIAYATAWLKCHCPAEFYCALLNAQPMGFYSPATIVGAAKRQKVSVLPVDVKRSEWECVLEDHCPALSIRMGLRYVKGLAKPAAPWPKTAGSVRDFAEKTGLDRKSLAALAEAGAFDSISSGRRAALWEARAEHQSPRDPGVRLSLPKDPAPLFTDLTEFETIRWDYTASNHSARNHPLAPLRAVLTQNNFPAAAEISRAKNGSRARYAGIVICRQRPSTAKGITFMTMEDETGFVNLIVKAPVYKTYSKLIKTISFLEVEGILQVHKTVVHLIAEEFREAKVAPETVPIQSHDWQ